MQPDSVVLTCALAALEKASEWQAAGSLLAAGILRELELEIFWGYGDRIWGYDIYVHLVI